MSIAHHLLSNKKFEPRGRYPVSWNVSRGTMTGPKNSTQEQEPFMPMTRTSLTAETSLSALPLFREVCGGVASELLQVLAIQF